MTDKPPALGIRHVALRVRDIEKAIAFWVEAFGYRLEWRPDPDNAYLTHGDDNLALHRVAVVEPAGALDHVGFVVERPEDVDAWAARLASLGIGMDAPPRTHRDGARSFYTRDPEGNSIQVLYLGPPSRGSPDEGRD